MHPTFSNIGAYLSVKRSASATQTAAGTGDATETNGASIDRYINGVDGSGGVFHSAKVFILAHAALGAAETYKLKATMQESSDDGDADAFADVAAEQQPPAAADAVRAADALVLTLTATDAGVYNGEVEWDVNLEGLERYVRLQVHADLSRAGTDVAFYTAGFALGGASVLPVD